MNNLRDTIWNKQVHPVVGILLFVISVLSIIWMSKNIITSNIKASGSSVPANVQVSNITGSSFTVSYTTSEQVIGSINYGKDGQLGSLALDNRDQQSGAPSAYYVHYFTLPNLTPSSTYYFSIDSSGSTYLNGGSFYTVTTGPVLTQAAVNSQVLKGTIEQSGGGAPQEAVVVVSSGLSQMLSALVKPDGTYSISLVNLRAQNLLSYSTLSADTLLSETVEDQTGTSHVTLLAGQTNPVPLISLGTNYDFSVNSANVVADSMPQSSAPLTGLPPNVNTIQVTTPEVSIPSPNETFNDAQPQFSGKGIANTQVQITLQSVQEQSATIQTDQYGNWAWRPTLPLAPGQHTLTIQTPNASGVMQTITRMFTVYAQGSEFTSPSGPPSVLTPTPSPAPATPTLTATPQPSPSPTSMPSPSVTQTATIAPTVATPVTGSSIAVYGTLGMLLIAGVGGLLFFFL